MAKAPPNIPEGKIGERVRLRANTERRGTVTACSPRMWMDIEWDDERDVPKICHQYELMTLPIDGS